MLYQLSYAPGSRQVYPRFPAASDGHGSDMGHVMEEPENPERREPAGTDDDEELLEQQEHKGYGEDEGEREESLPS